MKAREEILATWETEGVYTDWYAIDRYDPCDGTIRRLFVGTEDEAYSLLNSTYLTPEGLHGEPFYRIKIIGGDDAKAFFKEDANELPDERGAYSITEAAGILDVSRQRVHAMLQSGQLEGRKIGNTWNIYRYSVENRLAK